MYYFIKYSPIEPNFYGPLKTTANEIKKWQKYIELKTNAQSVYY